MGVHGAQCMRIVCEPLNRWSELTNFECKSEKSIQSECVCVRVSVCVCESASVCVVDGNDLVRDMTKLRTKPKQVC